MRFRPTTFVLVCVVVGVVLGVLKFVREHPSRPAGFDRLQGLNAISKTDTWEKKMRLMSEQAVLDSWNRYGVPLDYSDGSIKSLDAELDRITRSGEFRSLSEKDQRALGIITGAYVGEVIRRNHGGVWAVDSEAAGKLSFPVTIGTAESFPCTWCYKRLMNGTEDNIWDKYRYFVLGETNGMDYTLEPETNLSSQFKTNAAPSRPAP
jgi:hypothetical protein